MSRSRSSFELDGAIATATSLEPRRGPQSREPEAQEGRHYAGVKLVSFGAPAPARPPPPGAATPPPTQGVGRPPARRGPAARPPGAPPAPPAAGV